MKKVVFIGHGIPEPNSTGAGVRMVQLLRLFKEMDYEVHFCSTAAAVKPSCLDTLNIPYKQIILNCDSFNDFIVQLNPEVVVFDRFMTEEQFSWRVRESCPDAFRILDTEDLHFLRVRRKKNLDVLTPTAELSDIAKRELAAIYRSDLSLIISSFEFDLLKKTLGIPENILFYLPFLIKPESLKKDYLSFEEREGFYFIGNGKHAPNIDVIRYLHRQWPNLKLALPQASLHIYGAYLPESVLQLNEPEDNFFVHGYIEHLESTIEKHRVLLAPITFGAGQKRKIFDAWLTGSPVVTTSLGAEGIVESRDFGGFIMHAEEEFISYAVTLYTDAKIWHQASKKGRESLRANYNWDTHKHDFVTKMIEHLQSFEALRNKNIVGQLLWHHSLQSSKYLSKWIESKNSKK